MLDHRNDSVLVFDAGFSVQVAPMTSRRIVLAVLVGTLLTGAAVRGQMIGAANDGNTHWGVIPGSITIAPGAPDGTYSIRMEFANGPGVAGGNLGFYNIVVSGHAVVSRTPVTPIYLWLADYFAPGQTFWAYAEKVSGPGSGFTVTSSNSMQRQDCVSDGHGGFICPGYCCGVDVRSTVDFTIGSSCGGVTVNGSWIHGSPHPAHAIIDVEVGGILQQIDCEAAGCQSAVIPGAQYQLVNGGGSAIVSYRVHPGSYDYCSVDSQDPQTPTIATGSSVTASCGSTVTFFLDSHCATATPTPTPAPTSTPSPTPTPTVIPTPTPAVVPTPVPNAAGTSVTNGTATTTGTPGVGISNQDMYNDVKQALVDAGNAGTPPNPLSGLGGPGGGGIYDTTGGAGTDSNPFGGIDSDVQNGIQGVQSSAQDTMGNIADASTVIMPDLPVGCWEYICLLPMPGGPHTVDIDLSGYSGPIGAFRNLCSFVVSMILFMGLMVVFRQGVA